MKKRSKFKANPKRGTVSKALYAKTSNGLSISNYSIAVATMYNNESEELDVMIKTAEKIISHRKLKA